MQKIIISYMYLLLVLQSTVLLCCCICGLKNTYLWLRLVLLVLQLSSLDKQSACTYCKWLSVCVFLISVQDPPTFLCRGFCPPDPLGAGFNINWDNLSVNEILESLNKPIQVLFTLAFWSVNLTLSCSIVSYHFLQILKHCLLTVSKLKLFIPFSAVKE